MKKDPTKPLTVLAIAAHPDDIEFAMAGTLLQLQARGAQLHMWNLSAGSCGTATLDKATIIAMRWQEAQDAAKLAEAELYPTITDDFVIFYEKSLLLKVSARIREIKPDIVLTHSPEDYMEDHQNTARLAVAGAFARASVNFETDPPEPAWEGSTVVYHAMPHGLRNAMRQRVPVEAYVDITDCLSKKRAMLACHRSQKEWLDQTQGMDAYLDDMEHFARNVGKQSGCFEAAEGWRRHSSLGFASEEADPLAEVLGESIIKDPSYEQWLNA